MLQVILTTAPIAIELALKIRQMLSSQGAGVDIRVLEEKTLKTAEESQELIDAWTKANPV